MKRISFLQMVVLVALAASAASCSLPMGAAGDYYEEAPVRRNVYYGDPYYGSVNTIIVERDPYTGRYYQVTPGTYGSVYSTPAYPYNNRRYSKSRTYNNRNYNSGNNGSYRTYPQRQQVQQTPAQRQQTEEKRREAKDAILGKPRN